MITTSLILAANLLAPGDHGAVMGDGLRLQPDFPEPVAALNNVCPGEETLHGIDVSYYQGTIDWETVANEVDFALIRVSHSTQIFDTQFDANWANAHIAGVPAGVYQYFEPDEDPIAQADLLLEHMGPLMPGDLPPVIDVESTAGQTGPQIAMAVQAWVEHVEAALGVRPIIYTGPYFWQDNVGSDSFGDYPLWIAHYETDCPLTPTPWSVWDFHQYSGSGSTVGITGDVDQNTFNGSLDDLLALGTDEVQICGTIAADGGQLDNGDDCYRLYGNSMFWRDEAVGEGGSHVWTNATDNDAPSNYAIWRLWFEEAAAYELEVYLEDGYGESTQATYVVVHSDGTTEVEVDQSSASGWVSLGTFDFDSQSEFRVDLGDNTGEPNEAELAIVFDALRVTRIGGEGESSGGDTGGPVDGDSDSGGEEDGGDTEGTPQPGGTGDDGTGTGGYDPALPAGSDGDDDGCGCRTNPTPPSGMLLLLLGMLWRRRRPV